MDEITANDNLTGNPQETAGSVPQEQWGDPGDFDHVYDATPTKSEKKQLRSVMKMFN